MGVGRIALGALGVILILSARGVWTGSLLIGFRGTERRPGELYWGLSFGTPDTFNPDRADRITRTRKLRATVVLLLGVAFVAGLFSRDVFEAAVDGLALTFLAVVYALGIALGGLCLVYGLTWLYFGPKPGVAWIYLGRGTFWTSNLMTRPQVLEYLHERGVIGEVRPRSPPSDAERFVDEGVPGDPLEDAGQAVVAAVVPSRLRALALLAFGVLIYVQLIARVEDGGPLQTMLDVSNAVVWVTAGVILVRSLFSEHAAVALRAVFISVLGLGIAWLIGVTPGPIEAFGTIRNWF